MMKRRCRYRPKLLILVLAIGLSGPALAAASILNVTDLGDSGATGQLRTLITTASPGDTIVLPAGTVILAGGALAISTPVSIEGGGPDVTVIDGGRTDRVVDNCSPGVTLSLSRLTIRNGVFNGGRGGGIVNCTGNTLRVTDAVVAANSAGAGGGISNEKGMVILIRVTVDGNVAASGGGGLANIGESAVLSLTDVRVSGNQADIGGGILNNQGRMTLTNVSITANTADSGGGIDTYGVSSATTLSGVTVSGNIATGDGGGIDNSLGVVTLTNVTIDGNVADSGGGVNNYYGGLTLAKSSITGNVAYHGGGGLFNYGGTATLMTVRVDANHGESGGGLANYHGGITLANVLVSGNTAADGGGILSYGSPSVTTLTNVTVTGNTASGRGGGLRNTFGRVKMTNVTIASNTAQLAGGTGGGGIRTDTGSVSLKNSMVVNSVAAGNCSGGIESRGHNIDSGITCGLAAADDVSNTDPHLGPLQDNGGFTTTHALLPGSPALDTADNTGCPTVDQRGVGRPQGVSCDIGAYEQALVSPAAGLVAAVLPSSRSVGVGAAATAFATVINTGPATAVGCGLSLSTDLSAAFWYQTTDPATNALTGTANAPVDLGANQSQSFVFAITANAPLAPTDVAVGFHCLNATPAASMSGLNTLLLSASTTPVADIVALSATQGNTGVVTLGSVGAFAVATVNVGTAAQITVVPDTGSATLPITVALCETIPASGQCLAAATTTVTTHVDANATPTFAVFVGSTEPVSFDPAGNRIFIRFKDGGRVIRGATSVAVRTE